MGAGGSKPDASSTVNQLTEIATNVAMITANKCITAASQSQLLSIKGVKGDVILGGTSMSQGYSVNVKCLMSAEKQADLASNISSAFAQFAESKGESVLSALGGTSSEVRTNIHNKLTSNVDASSYSELSTKLIQQQELSIEDIDGNVVMKGVTLDQQSKLVAESVIDSKAYTSTINDLAFTIDQTATKEDKNPYANILGETWDGLGGAIDGVGGAIGDVGGAISGVGGLFNQPGFIIAIVVIVIVILVGGGLFLYFKMQMMSQAVGVLGGGGMNTMMASKPQMYRRH
uniref:Uncharacterized protein n=1 Tax=viral metagenome TaxID=1070528 RepID=A0A6C0JBD2_9ZZZZ